MPHRVSCRFRAGRDEIRPPHPSSRGRRRREPCRAPPPRHTRPKQLEKAYAARDAGEINRLETWLWLDGPGQPEGRVGGAARKLALDMNAVIIGNGVPETEGATGLDAWHRLAEIKLPAVTEG